MSNRSCRIIFMGTPEFAVPALESLINSEDFSVCAVVTQEDKPIGRSQTLGAPAIKVCAEKYEIPVLQPTKVREIYDELLALKPDLIVVVAYGQIIPHNILPAAEISRRRLSASRNSKR
ncbi:MAG: formyltransferase family protein [Candidatus Falkowbacteria bacterium]|nr:formyltransferase family protein [Candidatus Falkowbacteria bacterium]